MINFKRSMSSPMNIYGEYLSQHCLAILLFGAGNVKAFRKQRISLVNNSVTFHKNKKEQAIM